MAEEMELWRLHEGDVAIAPAAARGEFTVAASGAGGLTDGDKGRAEHGGLQVAAKSDAAFLSVIVWFAAC